VSELHSTICAALLRAVLVANFCWVEGSGNTADVRTTESLGAAEGNRSVMSDVDGTGNLLSPEWREKEYRNAVLWWNMVLSCMRYRFPFSFLLQGSFEQNLIAPMPED
jgi:hypothetical protein